MVLKSLLLGMLLSNFISIKYCLIYAVYYMLNKPNLHGNIKCTLIYTFLDINKACAPY